MNVREGASLSPNSAYKEELSLTGQKIYVVVTAKKLNNKKRLNNHII